MDLLNTAAEQLELPQTSRNVEGLLALLRQRGEPWQAVMTNERVQVTVNKQFAQPDSPLANDDEVALFPKQGFG